ncbi:MAG: helicase-exonuclease AddAB subunit AddA [Lachnospiraceae bacterium]|nr:helicase-exonuclease AddAB subunit AddA [Lachnospiraceae bacterium]
MGFDYTPDQKKVIETRNKDILVSAAAGSGKTAVLVERIAQMIYDENHPVDIDRLLVVTFTNAAAGEMRERIGEAIQKRILENPDSKHLARQAVLLHNAKICTLDSFCSNVLRNNFNDVDAEPSYRTPDNAEIILMQQDVLSEMLEDCFGETDEEKKRKFLDCVEFFSPEVDENKLEEIILKLYKIAQSAPFPDEWLNAWESEPIPETFEELEKSAFMKDFLNIVRETLEYVSSLYKEARNLVESPDGPAVYGELVDNEADVIESLQKIDSYSKLYKAVGAMSYDRLPNCKDDTVNPFKKERVKKLREEAKKQIKNLTDKYLKTSEDVLLYREQVCMKAIRGMIGLARMFTERYEAYKKDRNIMEFSDVAHAALKILVSGIDEDGNPIPTATAVELSSKFDEILVDEYQDTNYIQEYILRALSKDKSKNHLFMVGDVKQSIYRFRKARPELFIEKYDDFKAGGPDRERIDLQKNFRSRSEVLKITNDIFSRIMDRSYGGIDYDEDAALYEGADYPESSFAKPEFLITYTGEDSEKDVREAEAELIADKILSMVGKIKVWDKDEKEMRLCKYKDIVILFRKADWGNIFTPIFEEKGIPFYAENTVGFYETSEVRDVLQFLRVIDNPTRDVAMFGSLKSRFGGFSDEEIARIRVISGDKTKSKLYDDLHNSINNDCIDSILQEKIQKFLQSLQLYRELSKHMPVRELLNKIFDDNCYLEYVSALPSGARRLANARLLLAKAGDFEKTSFHGLFHFVRYIEQLEKHEADEGEAGLNDENADVVRIMTIHKSKGLEFPVTIIGGLSGKFNDMDAINAFVCDDDLGIGTMYIDVANRFKAGSIHRNVISAKLKRDSRAEELRVLYVAMTRAKEKLVLTAALKKPEELVNMVNGALGIRSLDSWRLPKYMLDCDNYLQYIMKALIRHPAIEPMLDELEIERDTVKSIPCPYTFCNDESEDDIEIRVVTEEDLAFSEGKRIAGMEFTKDSLLLGDALNTYDSKYYDDVMTNFKFVYPYENLKELFTKTSVSELKMAALAEEGEPVKELFNEEEIKPYIPGFKREKSEVSGTTRGSAFHKLMELVDIGKYTEGNFSKEEGRRELLADIENFVKEDLMTREYADAIIPDKILEFFATDLAIRMGKAQKKGLLYREQPFVYGIAANKIKPEFPEDEKILIQGIIDAFFVEDDRIILMDYKTDVINSEAELKERYKIQLDYYKAALERGREIPVAQTYIYSFHFGSQIDCN